MPHILIADDDPAMRSFLSTALTKAGHAVAACDEGRSAFAYLQDVQNPVDLLLTDIVMPGMDGIELSRRALEIRPDLKIMYITGFSMVPRERLPDGAHDAQVLAKPFHLSQLVNEVEKELSIKTLDKK